jgi:DNA-binding response OmpR family regulator
MSSKHVLVIEDDPNIAKTLQFVLDMEGVSSVIAPNGREGIRLFGESQTHFDIVLLDLMMPEMNGWQVLEWFRSQKLSQQPKIVMMTAVDDKISNTLLNVPILKKPVVLEKLLLLLQEH